MSKKTQNISFESALKELESITSQLESETIALEDSLQLFEKGIQLAQECQAILKNAEQKVIKLSGSIIADVSTTRKDDEG